MRIGFFTSIEGWGGSESYLVSLMKGVREAGHLPVLFGLEGTRLFREARKEGVECVAWRALSAELEIGKQRPEEGKRREGTNDFKGSQASLLSKCKRSLLRGVPDGVKLLAGNVREVILLKRIFANHPVDIMHVNLNGYEVAGISCRLCGIPSVGWHCIMPTPLPWSVRRWLYWWSGRMYTVMGGMSQTCVDAWMRWCKVPREKCRSIWNGIPLEKFLALTPQRRRAEETFVALAVGRLHPMKGFDTLVRAFGLLNDPRLKLVVAGEGPSEVELRDLASKQQGAAQIEFAGHCENMGSLYQKAHCMILPSVSHESFGLVLAEAMAAGLPLITSDYGPLPEVNVANETGLVVKAGASSELASAIHVLIEDPDLCSRFGLAGRCRARNCFAVEVMIDKMLGLYASVIAGTARKYGNMAR